MALAAAVAAIQARSVAPAAAVARVQERPVAPAAAVAAIQERSVAPAAAVAAIQERFVASAAAVAAIQERSVAPAAAVAAIQERYRGLEAAVAASRSVARPVTEAQGRCGGQGRGGGRVSDVDPGAADSRSPGATGPNIYYRLAWTCPLNGQMECGIDRAVVPSIVSSTYMIE